MVRQVLRHLEAFETPWETALVESHGQVALQVLPQLRVLLEEFGAVLDGALEVVVVGLVQRVI